MELITRYLRARQPHYQPFLAAGYQRCVARRGDHAIDVFINPASFLATCEERRLMFDREGYRIHPGTLLGGSASFSMGFESREDLDLWFGLINGHTFDLELWHATLTGCYVISYSTSHEVIPQNHTDNRVMEYQVCVCFQHLALKPNKFVS